MYSVGYVQSFTLRPKCHQGASTVRVLRGSVVMRKQTLVQGQSLCQAVKEKNRNQLEVGDTQREEERIVERRVVGDKESGGEVTCVSPFSSG